MHKHSAAISTPSPQKFRLSKIWKADHLRKILYSTLQKCHLDWLFCIITKSLPSKEMICLMNGSFNPDHRGQATTQMVFHTHIHHPANSLPPFLFFFNCVCLPCLGARERWRESYVALQESWQCSNPLQWQHFHWSEQMETCQVTTATGRPVRRLCLQAAKEDWLQEHQGGAVWAGILQEHKLCLYI